MERFELQSFRGTLVPKSKNFPWFLETKPDDSDVRTHLVKIDEVSKPELLAFRLYGDSRLYWVLVAFNSIHYNDAVASDIMNWPKAGQVIYYPSRQLALSI